MPGCADVVTATERNRLWAIGSRLWGEGQAGDRQGDYSASEMWTAGGELFGVFAAPPSV